MSLAHLLGPDFPDPLVVEETGSTNDDLKQRARAGAQEWSALVARRQRAGRGRGGNEWISPEGNLFLSVLLRPEPRFASLLPLLAGVAVAEVLEGLGAPTRLKWPNDVLVRGRKIAGVLCEAFSSGGELEGVVLGIGVNLALDPSTLAPPLREVVTSLRVEAARVPPVEEAAALVLRTLRVWYDALKKNGSVAILAAFRDRSVPWWGERVEVLSAGERISGVAQGLDPRGALLLERDDGSILTLVSGEARFFRRAE